MSNATITQNFVLNVQQQILLAQAIVITAIILTIAYFIYHAKKQKLIKQFFRQLGYLRVIDLDDSALRFCRIKYDNKNMLYYVKYKVGFLKRKKIILPREKIYDNTIVISNNEPLEYDKNFVLTNIQYDLKRLLKDKIYNELNVGFFTTYLLIGILVGVFIGIGAGYIINDYVKLQAQKQLAQPTQTPTHTNTTTTTTTTTTPTVITFPQHYNTTTTTTPKGG